MTGADSPRSPPATLLFDERCGLCNDAVQFVLRHERQRSLWFASLHGKYGLEQRARHPELNSVDSMVWLRPSDGHSAEVIPFARMPPFSPQSTCVGYFPLLTLAEYSPEDSATLCTSSLPATATDSRGHPWSA